jgi:flagellin
VTVDASKADPAASFTLTGVGAALTITDATSGVAQTVTIAAFTGAGQSQVLDFDALGIKMTLSVTAYVSGTTGTELATSGGNSLDGSALTLTGSGSAGYRVGAESTDNITVAFTNMQSAAIGSGGANDIADLVTDNNAVSTTTLADALLTSIDAAIGQVSTQRAKLGAAQNQMESAINSLGVSVENLSASESRIRDADIAQVSSELVTRQIMQQAGVAVLSQANSAPQSVLSLLRG